MASLAEFHCSLIIRASQPSAEHAKIEAEKKVEEEKRAAGQAAWQAYVASKRVRQLALWQKARARAVRAAEDARADVLCAVGPKRFIYAWRYVDRVHASNEEEYLLAPDHHTGEIALAHRHAANQHLASCEAKEGVVSACWEMTAHQGTRGAPQALLRAPWLLVGV